MRTPKCATRVTLDCFPVLSRLWITFLLDRFTAIKNRDALLPAAEVGSSTTVGVVSTTEVVVCCVAVVSVTPVGDVNVAGVVVTAGTTVDDKIDRSAKHVRTICLC